MIVGLPEAGGADGLFANSAVGAEDVAKALPETASLIEGTVTDQVSTAIEGNDGLTNSASSTQVATNDLPPSSSSSTDTDTDNSDRTP
jgi:hypothetical protein